MLENANGELTVPEWMPPVELDPARAAALRQGPGLAFAQSWLDETEPGFQEGRVWLGHAENRLYVFGEFEDRHIHSPATTFNDPLRREGDFFEILIRPEPQERYDELHVTPTGCRSQFRFLDLDYVRRLREDASVTDLPSILHFDQPLFEAAVRIDEEQGRWCVLACLYPEKIVDASVVDAIPANWRAAFCRWDVDPGTGRIVSSSTAPFREYNYHRHAEWHRLRLA